MNLDTIILLTTILLGVICIIFGIQIVLNSRGKFRVVIILFGLSVVFIIITNFLKLIEIISKENMSNIQNYLGMITMIPILSGVLLMRKLIDKIHNGYHGNRSKKEKKIVKSKKILDNYQPKNQKPVQKKKGSYMDEEGYLVIKK